MVDNATIDDLKSLLEKDQQEEVEGITVLFLDASSTCTGYTVANCNFKTKVVTLSKAGVLWLDKKDWSHQDKYAYIFDALVNYFWIVCQVDYIVMEQYSVNPNKMMGVQVLSELSGVIKVAAAQNNITTDSILPQTWRSQLKIKADVVEREATKKDGTKYIKKERDYKNPTVRRIVEYAGEIPAKSISNITGNPRTTPFDMHDSIGIALGWSKKLGFDNFDFSSIQYNSHIGHNIGE